MEKSAEGAGLVNTVVSVSPFRCCMWPLHDRMEEHIDELSCRAEIESFLKDGQLVPALGRPLPPGSQCDYELIYGARRLFIARHLNKPILVEVRNVTDLEGIVAMDIENRHRRDISPYERGVSYMRWLRAGHFRSQEDLSRALKVSASQVSRLLKLAMLPSAVLSAFESPLDICESWALDLGAALEDPARRTLICHRARTLSAAEHRLPPKDVYRTLLSAAVKGRKVQPKSHDKVITSRDGKPLFRLRYQSRNVALLLSVDKVSARDLDQVVAAVSGVLLRASGQETDSTGKVAYEQGAAVLAP